MFREIPEYSRFSRFVASLLYLFIFFIYVLYICLFFIFLLCDTLTALLCSTILQWQLPANVLRQPFSLVLPSATLLASKWTCALCVYRIQLCSFLGTVRPVYLYISDGAMHIFLRLNWSNFHWRPLLLRTIQSPFSISTLDSVHDLLRLAHTTSRLGYVCSDS